MTPRTPQGPPRAGRSHALRATLLAAGLFTLAFVVRITPLGTAFDADGVRFPNGNDEVYHVRRVVYAAQRFPEILDFDPYVSFPFGARPIWPPFFDGMLGAAIRIVVGPAEPRVIERVAFFVPPLLGAATVAVSGEIARRLVSPLAGLVTGIVLALLPAHFVNSRLGQLDNQGVVSLASALLLLGAVGLARERPGRAWPGAILTGLGIAAGVLTWPAFVLYLLPVQALAVAWVLATEERSRASGRARRCALPLAVAALGVAPFATHPLERFDAFSPLVLSRFQPLWLAAGGASLWLVAALWRSDALGATRARRVASALATGACGGALALALVPRFGRTLAHAGGWFTGAEPSLRLVEELRPLLFPTGPFDPRFATGFLSLGVLPFPLAWAALALQRGQDPARAQLRLVLGWSAALFAATLAQLRFADPFAVGLALTLGLAAGVLGRWVGTRSRPARLGFGLALVAALGLAFAPAARTYVQLAAISLRTLAGSPPPVAPFRKRVVEDAARFLHDESPPTSGYLDVSRSPEYGVLCSWDDGHLLRQRSERPTVQDNFGVFGDRRATDRAAAYYHTSDEEQAYRIARLLRARYVVATAVGSGLVDPLPVDSMAQRLWRFLGSEADAGERGGAPPLPALGRHRLIWLGASGRPAVLEVPSADRVALFEIVEGAIVSGEAEPGARVSFELALALPGLRTRYRASTSADAGGSYRIRLPYPTGVPASTQVRTADAYAVASLGRTGELRLTDEAVRSGAAVRGPQLRDVRHR